MHTDTYKWKIFAMKERQREVKTMAKCEKEGKQRHNKWRRTATKEHGEIGMMERSTTKRIKWSEEKTKYPRKEGSGRWRGAKSFVARRHKNAQTSAVNTTVVKT